MKHVPCGLILLLLPLLLAGCYEGRYHHPHRDGYRHTRHDHGYYREYQGRPPGWR
ncbi:hypothetical protein [Acetobacter sp.]|uniref:hypothetical protein n=1 Tax=Acetobacter sp. TaxID=440 RepID=UPI003F921CAA